MFELLREIHGDLKGTSLGLRTRREKSHFVFDTRYRMAIEVIQSCAARMGLEHPENITAKVIRDPLDIIPRTGRFSGELRVHIPLLLLIDQDDIPSHIRFEGSDDPRLEDNEAVQKFVDWLCDQVDFATKIVVNKWHRDVLKLYYSFLENPHEAKEALVFVIQHEIGHIHQYTERAFSNIPLSRNRGTLALLTLSAILLSPIAPYFAVPWQVTMLTVHSLALWNLGILCQSRERERDADLLAIRNSPEAAQGAMYLFKVVKEHQRMLRDTPGGSWKERLLTRLLFSPEGDSRFFYLSHPSETERIRSVMASGELPDDGVLEEAEAME